MVYYIYNTIVYIKRVWSVLDFTEETFPIKKYSNATDLYRLS